VTGCVLYELRRGVEPFGGNDVSVEQLLNRIRTVEPVQAPINFLDFNPDNDKSNLTHSRGKEKRSQSTADKAQSFGSGVFKSAVTAPSMTAELADLISWLLEKAPMYRCSWYLNMHRHLRAFLLWSNNHLGPSYVLTRFGAEMQILLHHHIYHPKLFTMLLSGKKDAFSPAINPKNSRICLLNHDVIHSAWA
jgi:serine/threonine protein kinase